MENGTLTAPPVLADVRSVRIRASAVLAALALVLTMFVLVQQPADAASAGAAVAAASVATFGAADAAQIDFRQIFCGILISIRNAFANSPFFSFISAFINQLIVAFGCAPS